MVAEAEINFLGLVAQRQSGWLLTIGSGFRNSSGPQVSHKLCYFYKGPKVASVGKLIAAKGLALLVTWKQVMLSINTKEEILGEIQC